MIGAMRWPLLIVTLLGFACSRAERQEHHAPDQLRTVRYPATATLPAQKVVIADRLSRWKPPEPKYRHGVLGKYARLVGSASKGAVTD